MTSPTGGALSRAVAMAFQCTTSHWSHGAPRSRVFHALCDGPCVWPCVMALSGRASALDVAVADGERKRPAQAPGQLLGDGDRAVAASRAPDGHSGVRLSLAQEALNRQPEELLRLV